MDFAKPRGDTGEEERHLLMEATGHSAGLSDAPYHPMETEKCVCVYAKLQM